MLSFSAKTKERCYVLVYFCFFLLLICPWAYFRHDTFEYSFLPRKIIYTLIGLATALTILIQKFELKRILYFVVGGLFCALHFYLNKYLEPHYIFELVYLEIAALVLFAPENIKQAIRKINPYVLYIVLIKAYFFREGSYVHGGFFSSNLFASYIMYLCFVEVHMKRWWNLLPATIVIYFAGSKAVYMGFPLMILMALAASYFTKIRAFKPNFFVVLAATFCGVLVMTLILENSGYYTNWIREFEPQRKQITELNMLRYGLVPRSAESEAIRIKDLQDKERSYDGKELSLTESPMISDVPTSLGLRIDQYSFMHHHLPDFLFVGDALGAQEKMFGHNPHSAIIDFFSRLGVLYFLLVLFFYRKIFFRLDSLIFNVSIIPILAFQPYGFTIGHSLPLLCLLYGLTLPKLEGEGPDL